MGTITHRRQVVFSQCPEFELLSVTHTNHGDFLNSCLLKTLMRKVLCTAQQQKGLGPFRLYRELQGNIAERITKDVSQERLFVHTFGQYLLNLNGILHTVNNNDWSFTPQIITQSLTYTSKVLALCSES